MPQRQPSGHRPARTITGLALSAVAAAAVAACGSPGSPGTASALGSVRHQDCTTIAGVLANGPDPAADPVGYAQAQVLPLHRLKIGDAPVRSAVHGLAAAYQAFSSGGAAARSGSGTAGTTAALHVSRAQVGLNKLCPHAAP